MAVCLAVWGIAIAVRLVDLHVARADYYRQRASQQHSRELELSPQRGAIRDRNGNDLAISIEVDSVYAAPAKVDDPGGTAKTLAPILGEPVDTLVRKLTDERSFVWLKRKITASQSAAIRAAGLPGVEFQQEARRFYPNLQLASHVLGFVNLDNEGVGGLEYQYEELIRGMPGKVIEQRDARNVTFEPRKQPPTEGASLTTTIDTTIQHFVEEEIQHTVSQTGAVGMTVIVMDPDSGAILAMANYPTFNPNEYSRYPEVNWSNRAIKHGYEPGSTFKIATAAAVLEEGLARFDEIVDGQNGSIMVNGYRIRDHQPFGLISFREVLQYSSNVGIIKFGTRLGPDRFARYIERYGFGERTGIDLMGEERGLVREPSDWSGLSSSVISMGQEILTTPLQILNLAATVANGGTMYRPFVVSRVDHVDGRVDETVPAGREVMSRKTVNLLQDALRRVVIDGTGRAAAIPGYSSAGKTGTAQKIDPATGRYSATKHVASFAGYAPARKPAIAMIVVIDEPRGAYHGGDVAAPVFGRLGERILRNLRVQPDLPDDLLPPPVYTEDNERSAPRGPESGSRPELVPAMWMPEAVSGTPEAALQVTSAVASTDPSAFPAPDFRGQPLREIAAEAARLGLSLVSAGSGLVVEQRPGPGVLIAPGGRIDVRLSPSAGAIRASAFRP